jgi:hypothetical protein
MDVHVAVPQTEIQFIYNLGFSFVEAAAGSVDCPFPPYPWRAQLRYGGMLLEKEDIRTETLVSAWYALRLGKQHWLLSHWPFDVKTIECSNHHDARAS